MVKTTRNGRIHINIFGLVNIDQWEMHFLVSLVDLYERCQPSIGNLVVGLSLFPKLKFEHIRLDSFSKMRVDLAAQVECII